MKNYLIAFVFLAVAASAHSAVESAKGNGFTRADACQSAKDLAASIVKAKYRKDIQSFSECSCSSTSGGGATSWTCTVDAYH